MNNDQLIEAFWIEQGGKPHDPADIYFYGSSWDMLMPVVEKINELCKQTGYIDGHDFFDMRIVAVAGNIKLVYAGVLNYIEWYNEQPKP